MITTSNYLNKKLFEDKDRQLDNRLVLSNVTMGGVTRPQEISPFVSNFGTIRREVEYDKGLFRPASHAFQIDNNLDTSGGTSLLSKRINASGNVNTIGTKSWITKGYDVYTGVKGSPENGNQGDYVHLYSGIIDKRTHDQISNKISVSSQDTSMKSFLQKKVCGKILKNTFMLSTAYQNQQIQQAIRYGVHRFPVTDNTGYHYTDIDSYGSCVLGEVNTLTDFIADSVTYLPGRVVYFPLYNDLETNTSDYESGSDKVRIWVFHPTLGYWVYFNRENFAGVLKLKIYRSPYSDIPGFYLLISPTATNLTYNRYDTVYVGLGMSVSILLGFLLDGTARIVTEILSEKTLHSTPTSCYPVTVAHDIITSARFGNLGANEVDESSMNVTPNAAYSFDAAYSYYSGIGELNCFRLRVDREISVQEILGEICRYCGLFIISTGKNQATPEATTSDRHIKIAILREYVEATDLPNTRIYSTNGEISDFITDEQGVALYQKIEVGYLSYHPGQYFESQRVEFFEGVTGENQYVGDNSSLIFGENKDAMCLFWAAPLNAAAVAAAYKAKYCEPNDIVDISFDCRGLVHFPSEYIGVYNHKTGELIVFQLYVHEYDLDGKVIKMSGHIVYSTYGLATGNIKPTIIEWIEGGSAGSPEYQEGGSAGSTEYQEAGKGA